jgi:hypothetical protein
LRRVVLFATPKTFRKTCRYSFYFFENETELLQVKQKQKPRFYFCCWKLLSQIMLEVGKTIKKKRKKNLDFFFLFFFLVLSGKKQTFLFNQKVIQQRVRCQEKG